MTDLQVALQILANDYYSNSQNFDDYSSLEEYVEYNLDTFLGV